ncbi:MAG: class I SAM-dependent methyltransferase [Acetatifactor sp.]|nr:class I SAM-dependent methyltransferase [Acetatifactor sp.]
MVVHKLEKMGEFFDNRIEGYEDHQLTCIEAAQEFYPFTASCLPLGQNVRILDLGCGTGLELDYYFKQNPLAQVTGIDLAPGMLAALENKFADRKITVIQGSYFTVPLGENCYDAAVSVESLHHFTKEEKVPLYCRVHKALKKEGYFLITDYFASSDAEEVLHKKEFDRLKSQKGVSDNEYYHYDIPLTVEHETQALLEAGFSSVEVLGHWGATYTLKALI